MRTIIPLTLVVLLGARAALATTPPSLSCPDGEPPATPANSSCAPTDCGGSCSTLGIPDAGDYDILALVHTKLHDIKVCDPDTKVGVNCPHPTGDQGHCGVAIHDLARYQNGSLLSAGFTRFRPKPKTLPSSIATLLSNGVPNADLTHYCLLDETARLRFPTDPNAPIIGDRNGDGRKSCEACNGRTPCDNGCHLDLGDVEDLCGFHTETPPAVYSPCGEAGTVTQFSLRPGDPSTLPLFTGQTLTPGYRYRSVVVKPNAVVTLAAGDYEICSLTVENGATVKIPGTTGDVVLHVGALNINALATFGQPDNTDADPMMTDCPEGPVRMIVLGYGTDGKKKFGFGNKADVRGYFCGPARTLQLGQNSRVIGRVIAREIHGGEPTTFIRCPKS